ncbi:MAG TPA: hypothetical protein VFC44_13305 [Candidatus Saccharimonadales bacterium]|nr:hypothetical protein [Candidatus Saccharimonadales bacterium]
MRITFRWLRIAFWFALFLAVAAVAYLHLIGLPDFLKRPLLTHLRSHGFEAQFSNVRLGWGPSLIIDNAAFRRAHQPLSPRLSAAQTELAVDLRALVQSRIELKSLRVADAQLQVPVSATNGDVLSLNQVRLGLAFSSNDFLRLHDCEASFRGIEIQLNGEASHFRDLRNWKFPSRGGVGKTNQSFQSRLRQISQTLDKIHFTGTPVLDLDLTADGRDMNSLRGKLQFTTVGAQSPWGEVTKLQVIAACAHAFKPGSDPFLQVRLTADALDSHWARSRAISLITSLSATANSNLEGVVRLDVARPTATLSTNTFHSASVSCNGSITLASTNFTPVSVNGKLRAIRPESPWGTAREVSLSVRAARAPDPPSSDTTWGPWARFGPYLLNWQTDVANVVSPKLRLDHLVSSGHWRGPKVVIENLQAKLYGGQLQADGVLDVTSREANCHASSDFNPHEISQLLTPAAQHWMSQYDWTTPPKVVAAMRLVLPPWSNRPPDWRTNLKSSLEIAGDFTVGPASFRNVWATSAQSHFTYTNRVWDLPRLHAVRSDGDVYLDYTGSDETHDFHFLVDSRLDPKDSVPLLPPLRQKVLDDLAFPTSPNIHAEVWGRWHASERIGFTATLLATNFTARGERVNGLNAYVEYTNKILRVHDLRVSKDKGHLTIPFVEADFDSKKVTMTNAASTLDPNILPRVLGPKTPKFLTVIHFDIPPSVSASGSFSMRDPLATDLHFFVRGQQFHWSNILADRIDGGVDWQARTVVITNIEANLYKTGTFVGWMVFDYVPKHGSDFRTTFTATDIDLSSLVKGFTAKTNRLEGMLDGNLTLAGPSTTNHQTWQGRGRIHVHDAMLWDIKIFGLLSPVLNAISPGAGNSRARAATATFIITNSGVSTDDFEIRSSGFRLGYRGTVDMNRVIDARVEADLLRDTPLFGPLLSAALIPLSKLFEYRISGTLHNPVMEPLYLPKFIMLLLRPFHTLKSLSNPPSSLSPTPPLTAPKDGK